MEYCDHHYGHLNESKFLGLDDNTIKQILDLGKLKVDTREIYRRIRTDFKDKKIKACNLITMDQIRYHLKN